MYRNKIKTNTPLYAGISSVNAYLSQRKIKQTYISLKTGIDINELTSLIIQPNGIHIVF